MKNLDTDFLINMAEKIKKIKDINNSKKNQTLSEHVNSVDCTVHI